MSVDVHVHVQVHEVYMKSPNSWLQLGVGDARTPRKWDQNDK